MGPAAHQRDRLGGSARPSAEPAKVGQLPASTRAPPTRWVGVAGTYDIGTFNLTRPKIANRRNSSLRRETPCHVVEPLNKDRVVFVVKVLAILACLYLFLVGIAGIGHSFQLFGGEFADAVLNATQAPVAALFIGILATSLVQSSSTTSSVIVGMVAGGTISTKAAVFMIMGANVGTTVTNTIVSVGHVAQGGEFRRAFAAATVHDFFNLIAVAILFPVEWATGFLSHASVRLATVFADLGGLQLGNPVKAATEPAVSALAGAVGHQGLLLLLITAALTVGALFTIVRLLRSLALSRIETALDERLFRNAGRSMLVGVAVTMAVQSSSISTSLVVPMVAMELLTLRQIFPYTLGANVGTTFTANLAALSTGNVAAVTVSLAHLLFNVCGIVLVWPISRVRGLPIYLAEKMADATMRSRLVPLIYVAVAFFGLPFLAILAFR